MATGIITLGLLQSVEEVILLGLDVNDVSSPGSPEKVTLTAAGVHRVTVAPTGPQALTLAPAGANRVTMEPAGPRKIVATLAETTRVTVEKP